MLLAFTGRAGSGKDTAAKVLIEKYGFVQVAFASPLKDAAKILFCLSDHQLHDPDGKETVDARWGQSPRQMLQILGTDLIRSAYPDIFVRNARIRIQELLDAGRSVVVTDVRFANESQLVKDLGGTVVKVVRPNHVGTVHAHATEEFGFPVDTTIHNDGSIAELWHKTTHFIL